MQRYVRHTRTALLLTLVIAVLALAFLFSGVYNIAANDPHTPAVYRALETLRDRSIAVRSKAIEIPDLSDAALIRQGAGNYHAMCTGCHLMPGMADSELYNGLYPQPPNLTQLRVEPRRAFWVVKHGIKASGMPAWGKSMEDRYLWGLVAFQQKLPELTPETYQALVATSGGHSHGGGETEAHTAGNDMPGDHHDMAMPGMASEESMPHGHAPGTPADHHVVAATPSASASAPPPAMIEHRHADGTVESHPAPATPAKADDGHDHAH